MLNFHVNSTDQEREEDEDYGDVAEKLSALYGDDWKNKSPESLMDNKYFREIPEFHQENIQRRKILTCGSVSDLFKAVQVILKKSNLDPSVIGNYKPI